MPWTPIRTMARGDRPDFTILNEPRNAYVTDAQRWFTDQLVDLQPGTVIAGWYSHKPGYHDTVAHNDARSGIGEDYSARDPQDRRGPRDRTRAADWTFRDAQAGNYADFAKYGDRLLAAYRANDPRLAGWREYLGRVSTALTVSGKSTKRVGIDFRHRYLRIPDDTHDWHAHFSESTEHVESFWNKWALLTILAGWSLADWRKSIEEDDMPLSDADVAKVAAAAAEKVWAHTHVHPTLPGQRQSKGTVIQYMDAVHDAQTGRVLAALQALGVELGEDVDEQAIVTGILAGLTPELAAALPPDLAQKVVDVLLDRIAAAAQAQA